MSKMDFLPMPVDAMFDARLTLAHVRVLGAVALHDRRGANGRGCFATISTLAKIAGFDTRTVKRALSELRTMNFITSEQSKQDARRLVHRVVYQSDLQEIGDTHAPDQPENRGHPTQGKGTWDEPVLERNHEDAPPKQNSKQIQGEADPENRRHSYRKDAQTMPSAGRYRDSANDGEWLRQVKEELPKVANDRDRMVEIYNDLDDLLDATDYGDKLWGWARGVQEQMQEPMYWLGCFNDTRETA